jgi:hypothetical protein
VTTLSSDANLVNALASEAFKEEPLKVETVAPDNNEITLPGGYITPGGALSKYAEVRELNGEDEEAISRAGSLGKSLSTILQRGLVSIGGEPVDKYALDEILAADRDAIMLAIRRITFGDEVEYRIICNCGANTLTTINLIEDVIIKELNNPIQDRTWTSNTKLGEVIISLPTGVTQKLLIESTDKTTAELSTILLSGCIQSINGNVITGASSILKLGMKDRENLIQEIMEKNPGPRLGEVKKACEACGEDVETPLSLVALFRL